jgi:hypothetical protein
MMCPRLPRLGPGRPFLLVLWKTKLDLVRLKKTEEKGDMYISSLLKMADLLKQNGWVAKTH